MLIASAAIALLLLAAAAGVGGLTRWLDRSMPRSALVLSLLLAVLPFPRAFLSDLTPLPLDHAVGIHPWVSPGQPPPYNPYLSDIATQILPWARATRQAWREGELPWRDRWNGCGMPLAANGVSAAFSPLTLLSLVLPLARGFTLMAALKLFLAASGMWLWTREIGASRTSASFAAVAFALSLLFAPPWIFFPQSAVFCLWPWTLFLIERCRDPQGRLRAVAALAGLFAVTVLAGHPESAAMGFLFAALWIAARFFLGDLPELPRVASAIAAAASIAAGLTAFLLIPSVHAIAASGRLSVARRPYWEPILSLAPHGPQWRGLPTLLFPHTLGNGVGSPTLPVGTATFPEMSMGYIGVVGWIAAFLVFRPGSRRKGSELVLWGLLVCGLGVAVGQWPMAEIFARIPVIALLFPPRFNAWIALSAPAIAALEFDRLEKDVSEGLLPGTALVRTTLAIGFAAALVFLWFLCEHLAAGGLLFQTHQLAVILAVLAAAAAVALAARHRPAILVPGLTLLCGAELLYQWRGISKPMYPAAMLFPETPLTRFLHRQAGVFRVVGEGPILFPSTNVFAGVEDIRTHDAVERHDYLTFLDATCGYPYEYFKKIRDLDCTGLDFLNVRFLLAAPDATSPGPKWGLVYSGADGRVFENGRALPRAFAPEEIRLVAAKAPAESLADANAAFGTAFAEIARNPDWGRIAWVLSSAAGSVSGGRADISEYREFTNEAALRVRVRDGAAYVVLSLVQDGGWSARDAAGNVLELLRANGPFLALKLLPGDHRVRLRYRPPGWDLGVRISSATAAALLLAGLIRVARRRGVPVSG